MKANPIPHSLDAALAKSTEIVHSHFDCKFYTGTLFLCGGANVTSQLATFKTIIALYQHAFAYDKK